MKSVRELIKDRQNRKEAEQKVLRPFQVWALEFCKRFGVERKDVGVIMRYAKEYENSLDYLRYVEGWLDDYPKRQGNVVKLFLWKIRQDKMNRSTNAEDS